MRPNEDITGRRFGRLTAIASAGMSSCWVEMWKCRCDCGREVVIYKTHLLSGHTKSCGCLRSETISRINKKRHGNKAALGRAKNTGKK